jgi:hypothetical protein
LPAPGEEFQVKLVGDFVLGGLLLPCECESLYRRGRFLEAPAAIAGYVVG